MYIVFKTRGSLDHFLLECHLYKDLRKKYVKKILLENHKYAKIYRTYYVGK